VEGDINIKKASLGSHYYKKFLRQRFRFHRRLRIRAASVRGAWGEGRGTSERERSWMGVGGVGRRGQRRLGGGVLVVVLRFG
jgi:hypothetical protein